MEEKKTDLHKYAFKETPKFVRVFFTVMKYLILISACLIVVIPLAVVILGSLKTHADFLESGAFDLPKTLHFENFRIAFEDGKVMQGLINTAIISPRLQERRN